MKTYNKIAPMWQTPIMAGSVGICTPYLVRRGSSAQKAGPYRPRELRNGICLSFRPDYPISAPTAFFIVLTHYFKVSCEK
jgi:hypothetical protein